MKQRQHSQERVLGAHVGPGKHRLSLAQQVAMGEHDALRVGRRSGRVEERSQIVRFPRYRREAVYFLPEKFVEIYFALWRDGRPRPSLGMYAGSGQHNGNFRSGCSFPRNIHMFGITDNQGTAAIAQELRYLVRVIGCVQWHRGASHSDDAKVRCNPAWMVVGQNCNPRARLDSTSAKPRPKRFCHAAELAVRVALDAIRPLNFNRDVFRPAFGALDEAVVKSGHQWRKYT